MNGLLEYCSTEDLLDVSQIQKVPITSRFLDNVLDRMEKFGWKPLLKSDNFTFTRIMTNMKKLIDEKEDMIFLVPSFILFQYGVFFFFI